MTPVQKLSHLTLATLALAALLPASGAFAMGAKPSPLTVDSIQVNEQLLLRDESAQSAVIDADMSQVTPAPGDIDVGVTPDAGSEVLCGDLNKDDISILMRQTDATLALAQILMRLEDAPMPRSLTATEMDSLRKIPVCAPYATMLASITAYLRGQVSDGPSTTPVNKVQELLFTQDKQKDPILQLKTASGQLVDFKLSGKASLDNSGHPIGVTGLSATAASSGQNLGVKIDVVDIGNDDTSNYDTTESCTGTDYRRECRDGDCRDVSVTWYGHRSVHSTTTTSLDSYSLSLIDASNRVAAVMAFAIYNSNDGSNSYGPCIEDSYDRPTDPWNTGSSGGGNRGDNHGNDRGSGHR